VAGTDLIAGAEIPKAAAYFATRELLGNLLFVALLLLAAAAVVSMIWSQTLTRSIARLADATREIAKGRFDVDVKVGSRDEIGRLAQAFNQMARELNARERALRDAEGKLIQSEKMAAFGQLGAGVAHEVKKPARRHPRAHAAAAPQTYVDAELNDGLATMKRRPSAAGASSTTCCGSRGRSGSGCHRSSWTRSSTTRSRSCATSWR